MAARLFRWMLRLLPEDLRDGYAREIEATFRAESRDAAGRWRLAGLWVATIWDVLRAAPREHADVLVRDLRVAWRAMAARPAHTLTAVTTLAIGIGANVAMFGVIDAVLLAPLPYRDPGRLVTINETREGTDPSNVGYLSFADLRTRSRSFSHLVAASQSTATFSGDGQDAERVNAMRVSREYFDMVGVQPAVGRAFTEAEDRPGPARRVVILSDALWRRRFGADAGVIGRTVNISDIPYVIVGVMPRGYDDIVASRFFNDAALWFPLGYDPAAPFACRSCRHLTALGRLAPGITPAAAQRELSTLFAGMEREHPTDYHAAGAQVMTLGDVFLGPVRPALLLLWGGVGLLLLVACANVASLLVLRASERAGEVAVRAALGVTRARLVRQLITESVLLAGAGALAGLVPAWVGIRLIARYGPTELPRLASLAMDGRAVLVAVALALASGVLFGLAPLRTLTRRNAADALRTASRRTAGADTWRTRAVYVAGTMALAAVLLTASGVLARGVGRLLAVEPGVVPEGVLTMRLWAGGARFDAGESAQQIATAVTFYDGLLDQVRALPGVSSAAAVTTLPLGGGVDGYSIHIAGRPLANPEEAPSADRFVVTPGYFATMGIPLLRGRFLDARDGQQQEHVALINRQAADTLFAGDDPLGKQVMLGPPNAAPRTIVGIVGDVRHHGLDQPVGPQVYVPQAQWAWAETQMTLVLRTAGPPEALAGPVRSLVRELDPSQPVTDVQAYSAVVAATTGTRRFVVTALGVFGVLALVLAAVGLYGALSVTVAQRQREIGIRFALGARAETVRQMVFMNGLRPVVVGTIAGVLAATLAMRALSGLRLDVSPGDPAAVLGAAAVLLSAAIVVCAVPAWRAMHIDPAASLRAE